MNVAAQVFHWNVGSLAVEREWDVVAAGGRGEMAVGHASDDPPLQTGGHS